MTLQVLAIITGFALSFGILSLLVAPEKYKLKVRELLRRKLTDLLSMTSWPLEAAGAFALWHYGSLFSSSVIMSRDWRATLDQIMPNDGWGIVARALAYTVSASCFVSWMAPVRIYGLRIVLSVIGLIVWAVLVYSCWRADVPREIYRWYIFFLITQLWVAILLHVHYRAEKKSRHEGALHQGRL